MKKALITGIAGFSGGYLAEYLLGQKISLYGIDIKPSLSPAQQHLRSKIKLSDVNLLNRKSVMDAVKRIKPDYIFHLAGLLKGDNLAGFMRVNVEGTQNILEAASAVKAKVLISGSSAEYGLVAEDDLPVTEQAPLHPVNYYGISKIAQTMLGHHYFISRKLKVYLPRVFNMTGPGEPTRMVCASLARQIRDVKERKIKPIIHVGDLTPKRDFIDVRDVIRAYWLVINKGKPGEIYNICSGKAHSIKEILSKMLNLSHIKRIVLKHSYSPASFVDVPIQRGDNSKIRKHTGWQSEISLEQTLKDMLK